MNDRLIQHSADLESLSAHVKHRPVRAGDSNFLSYIGNGYFGLSMSDVKEELFVAAFGQSRTLTVPVAFKPLVHVSNSEFENYQSARLVNYVKGLLHDVMCYNGGTQDQNADISISRVLYAHRAIPEVFVQELKISNPTGADQFFTLERQGIANWPSAVSSEKT